MLLTHRFYAPDVTTYAQMLRILAEAMERDGSAVTIFSTQPGYNRVYKGPPIASPRDETGVHVIRRRVPFAGSSVGRLIGGFVFAAELVAYATRNRGTFQVITVSTVPPVVMGLAGVAASKIANAALVYHCMDLYPEIAVSSGLIRPGLAARVAARLDTFTASHALVTVVLSADMKRTLLARAPRANVAVINNFVTKAPPTSSNDGADGLALAVGPCDILFAGNLGRFQGLEDLLDGFARAAETIDGYRLVFMGNGSAKSDLQDRVRQLQVEDRVEFVPHQPAAVATEAASKCRLAVISLAPGIIRAAYPSKTITYLEAGARLLCIAETDSELSRLVREQDLGATVEPGNAKAIAQAIVTELGQPADSEAAERAKATAKELFDADSTLPKWEALFEAASAAREARAQ